ncbi:MAG: hypothetical protein GXO88_12590, partial [Chlorobi bacterium]|nr:hypothetical protein [Chlorobiota bacterium]
MKKFTLLVFTLSLILTFTDTYAQISEGGTPPSIMFQLDNNIPKITFESPDLKKIAEQDKIAEASKPDPRRMGVSVKINKGIDNAGSWESLPGGGKVWRMQ